MANMQLPQIQNTLSRVSLQYKRFSHTVEIIPVATEIILLWDLKVTVEVGSEDTETLFWMHM